MSDQSEGEEEPKSKKLKHGRLDHSLKEKRLIVILERAQLEIAKVSGSAVFIFIAEVSLIFFRSEKPSNCYLAINTRLFLGKTKKTLLTTDPI